MIAPLMANRAKTIPTIWRERIVKRNFSVVLGKMLQPQQATPEETEEPYLRSANVHWDGVNISDVKTMWFSPSEKRDLLLKPGDLLVNEGGDVGRSAVWNGELAECYFQNAINRIRPMKREIIRFLYYWLFNLKQSGYIDAIVSKTTIGHLTAEKLERVPWPDVPLDDQKRIATYLDASCAAIDAAVTAKRHQIKFLDSLRKSIIHCAVTQGINTNIKLRDSQESWLGKVPAHWIRSRIRNVATLSPGYSCEPPSKQEECTIVPMELLSNDGLIDVSNQFPLDEVQPGLTLFEEGDVIFAKITPCMENGKGAFVNYLPTRYGFGSTEFHVLRPSHVVLGKFLYYFTWNSIYRAYAAENMTGAAGQKRVSSRFLKDSRLFLPPLFEQKVICTFLDTKIAELKKITTCIQQQITSLLSYRKSLIHECVTGERRVTEADVARVEQDKHQIEGSS